MDRVGQPVPADLSVRSPTSCTDQPTWPCGCACWSSTSDAKGVDEPCMSGNKDNQGQHVAADASVILGDESVDVRSTWKMPPSRRWRHLSRAGPSCGGYPQQPRPPRYTDTSGHDQGDNLGDAQQAAKPCRWLSCSPRASRPTPSRSHSRPSRSLMKLGTEAVFCCAVTESRSALKNDQYRGQFYHPRAARYSAPSL